LDFVFWKVSLKPFQRLGGAAALGGRARKREALPMRVSFLLSFFLCASCVKEKSGQ
jgi:hypothetical protein